MDMEKLPPDELAKATNVGMDKDMEKKLDENMDIVFCFSFFVFAFFCDFGLVFLPCPCVPYTFLPMFGQDFLKNLRNHIKNQNLIRNFPQMVP